MAAAAGRSRSGDLGGGCKGGEGSSDRVSERFDEYPATAAMAPIPERPPVAEPPYSLMPGMGPLAS